jgi:serine phosphatase RsbU (regulator of sigma subunit)
VIKIVKRFAAAERALRDAAPHRLVEALRLALTTLYGAESVELLLVDYGLTVLQPVCGAPRPAAGVALHNTAAGRAFGSQQAFAEDAPDGRARLHLPVTVRGDRLGVLRLTVPAGSCDTAALAELADVAEVLGREVLVAERDTDLYLQARRRSRLTLAAEMQWRLLPGHSRVYEEFAWGAHLEPAHAIHGDSFDLSAAHDRLALTVTSGMGQGVEAAVLTNLTISALRNARRAGIGVADRAALADQAVFAQYRGKAYAASLLLDFEVPTGRVQVVDAGSPRLWRLRAGAVEPIGFEAQLPLGMFEETDYVAQEFRVEPGDRLVFASDSVHAGASRAGERALVRAIASTRLLSAAETPRAVLRELTGHRNAATPDDDALVLCLDWYGR